MDPRATLERHGTILRAEVLGAPLRGHVAWCGRRAWGRPARHGLVASAVLSHTNAAYLDPAATAATAATAAPPSVLEAIVWRAALPGGVVARLVAGAARQRVDCPATAAPWRRPFAGPFDPGALVATPSVVACGELAARLLVAHLLATDALRGLPLAVAVWLSAVRDAWSSPQPRRAIARGPDRRAAHRDLFQPAGVAEQHGGLAR